MTALPPADAVDAFLITGGSPEIVQRWRPGTAREDFLRDQLTEPLSPLLMAGELSMLGAVPEPSNSGSVLEAIGTGERTFSTIANRVGVATPLPSGTLAPILNTLAAKRIVAADTPLATRPDTRNKRYRIEDPYLRFWLAFLQRGIPEVERGRGTWSPHGSSGRGPPGAAGRSSRSSGPATNDCSRTTGCPARSTSAAGGTGRTTPRSTWSAPTRCIRRRGSSPSPDP